MTPTIKALWIVYDPACGLCCMVRDWILAQPSLVTVNLIAAGSPETQERFPQLPPGELAVVSDTGDVWLGDRAWIICLWALRDYRKWSVRLSSPMLLPLARQAFSAVSRNRTAFSQMLQYRTDEQVHWDLRQIMVPRCETPQA